MTMPVDCHHEAFAKGRAREPFKGLRGSQTEVCHAVGAFLASADPDCRVTSVDGYDITVESFSGAWTYRLGADGVLTWVEVGAGEEERHSAADL
jgi:hypothetical protein